MMQEPDSKRPGLNMAGEPLAEVAMVECPTCEGEKVFESGVLCPGAGCTCDGFSGGCTEFEACDECEGSGEVELEDIVAELIQLRAQKD
jgi:hypothetical protein